MLFNSFVFFGFLLIVIPLYYSIPRRHRNLFLLASSYFFYGYWDYRFTGLLLISTLVDYTLAKKIYVSSNPKFRKGFLLISLIVNLGILAIFKYYGFFIQSFEPLVLLFGGSLDFLHLNVILPVGISFYTFQTMAYTIDVYRGRMSPARNPVDFAVYVAFFPQLVAGPIERAQNLLPQISANRLPTRQQVKQGIVLISYGMFKKVMIGDTSGRFVDHVFSQPDIYNSPELLTALILFAVQIYADFSGYSNIARGTSKLLGIELMKNFEQPYLSRNITEFWRRWHISLSTWLRDYLYISLGGNRDGRLRTYLNLMITMLLGGLWHGASWNFVIWGGLHGLYLAVHKMFVKKSIETQNYSFSSLFGVLKFAWSVLLTNLLVLITWLFFRASDFETSKLFISRMVHWQPSEYSFMLFKICSSYLLVLFLFDFLEYYTKRHTFILGVKQAGVRWAIIVFLLGISFLYMFQSEPMPFIYFQF